MDEDQLIRDLKIPTAHVAPASQNWSSQAA